MPFLLKSRNNLEQSDRLWRCVGGLLLFGLKEIIEYQSHYMREIATQTIGNRKKANQRKRKVR